MGGCGGLVPFKKKKKKVFKILNIGDTDTVGSFDVSNFTSMQQVILFS